MNEEELAAYRAEQAAKKALQELAKKCKTLSDKELKKHWKDIHKAKDVIKKQFRNELKKIGTKNPNIGVDPTGKIVLQNPLDPTKIVPTGLPPEAFAP
jgi:phosphoenolpyruvate-protein kinase (PTS system EI component)